MRVFAITFVACCSLLLATATAADRIEPLVTADWLAKHLHDPELVVLDATVLTREDEDGNLVSVTGRAQYEQGHIPGAAFADLFVELADTDSDFEYAVPSPQAFAAAMGRLGVGDDSAVVIYDGGRAVWAARVWWMLRWIGFDNAAILDGGLPAWQAGGQPLSTAAPDHPERSLTVRLRPQLIVGPDEVMAAIDDETVELVDALPEGHYRGEWTMYARPGHIRSASNIPIYSVTDENGRFRPRDELRELFADAGDQRTIHYCGGGIAASGTAFAMTLAGYDDVAVYTNSLQEWAAHPDKPMETATDTAQP